MQPPPPTPTFRWVLSSNIFWIMLAIVVGLQPIGHTPHLVDKLSMLWHGQLRAPLDWFDLSLHSFPLLVLLVKGVVEGVRRKA